MVKIFIKVKKKYINKTKTVVTVTVQFFSILFHKSAMEQKSSVILAEIITVSTSLFKNRKTRRKIQYSKFKLLFFLIVI